MTPSTLTRFLARHKIIDPFPSHKTVTSLMDDPLIQMNGKVSFKTLGCVLLRTQRKTLGSPYHNHFALFSLNPRYTLWQ